jgi:hypothetical protein
MPGHAVGGAGLGISAAVGIWAGLFLGSTGVLGEIGLGIFPGLPQKP